MQAWDTLPAITSTTTIYMFAVLPLIEWKPWQLCRAKALHYRGVTGQWQDVGRSRFDVVRHGGRCDPAGSAALFFALP